MVKSREGFGAILLSLFLTTAPRMTSQQPAQASSPSAPASASATPAPQQDTSAGQKGLADFAREQRDKKAGNASPAPTPATQPQPQGQRSLAEIAKERATNKRAEIKVNENDSQQLFSEISETIEFASRDSGLPKRTAVRHQLVGQDEVNRYMAVALSDLAEVQRVKRSEIVLKKFGYLPRDFDLKNYLLTASTLSLGGFYDPKTKTMNLVNWVGLEQQRPIMAHELTHALQDQNYDLTSWLHWSPRGASMRVVAEDAAESNARRAVVEGQAMIVFFDYLLKPYGRTLADTPGATDFIKDTMTNTYDTSLVVHNSPLMLKDSALFPYREGLLFELELLRKGGNDMAFTGVFSRPPLSTHEILEPSAYLQKERQPYLSIPDLSSILRADYEAYDSGTIGQLDARILAQELGSENDMFAITPDWLGGAYVAVAHKSPAGAPVKPVSTADVALLYVSRWKTREAAQRFLEIYQKSLGKRVTVSDTKPWLPAGCSSGADCAAHRAVRVDTSEGPVFLELLTGDTVFIAHSFVEETVNSLRQAVLRHPADGGRAPTADLSLRLLELPAFHSFQEQVGSRIVESFARPNEK